jgi:phospholipid transport system substrate-binding protein
MRRANQGRCGEFDAAAGRCIAVTVDEAPREVGSREDEAVMRAMVRRRIFWPVLLLIALFAGAARADTPPQTIQEFYNALLGVMKEGKQLGFQGRYKKLEPVIEKTFNLPLMTRLAVGPQWTSLPPDQQQKITQAFSDMTISTYANRFDDYSGEKFEVSPQVKDTNGGKIVETKLIKSNGEPVTLNYLMREDQGNWKVIDVFLSGTVSELATRRSEFSSTLRRDGSDGLLKLIQKRTAEMRQG